jgi:hypothetical protein
VSLATPAIHGVNLPSMRHTLKLHGVVVGWSDLERVEPDLGRARGRFRPGIGYELIQPVFRLFAEAVPRSGSAERDEAKLARYHRSRDALKLELVDPAGKLIPTSAIHIADYRADDSGDCELDVLITDAGYWERRFLSS